MAANTVAAWWPAAHPNRWRARRKVTPRRRFAECWAKEWRHEPVHEATARFRRVAHGWAARARRQNQDCGLRVAVRQGIRHGRVAGFAASHPDRKSTRLNSSHLGISY